MWLMLAGISFLGTPKPIKSVVFPVLEPLEEAGWSALIVLSEEAEVLL